MDCALTHAAAALFGRCGNAFVFLCGGDYLLRGLHGDADGFFADDVHAAGKELAGKHVMQPVGPADVGAVQALLAIEQFLHGPVGVHTLTGVAFNPFCHGSGTFGNVVDGGDDAEAPFVFLHEFGVSPEMRSGNAAAADDGEVHPSCHWIDLAIPFLSVISVSDRGGCFSK